MFPNELFEIEGTQVTILTLKSINDSTGFYLDSNEEICLVPLTYINQPDNLSGISGYFTKDYILKTHLLNLKKQDQSFIQPLIQELNELL